MMGSLLRQQQSSAGCLWLCLLLIFALRAKVVDSSEEILDFIPNVGDVEVVEGRGGNYKFMEEDNVLILTRENFHYYVMSRPLVLVEFYAPWCGHCKTLAPEYSKASEKLQKSHNITLAKVDATKEVELATEFMITGYPSIILFSQGKKVDEYQGKHTDFAIVDYIKEKLDPNWKPPSAPVITLTSTNFTQTIKDAQLMLVQFYAPWCKHCQQLEPEYESAARSLQEYGIVLAKVDGPSEKELANSLQIVGWPTLKVYRKGRVFDYKGPREHQGIVDHMKQLSRPPSKRVDTVGELKSQLDRTETNILGFFPSESSELYKEFMAAAEQLRGIFTVMHTFNKEVTTHFKANPNTIVVHQPEIFHSKYEKSSHEYAKAHGHADDIIKFIRFYSVPLVGQRTKRNEAFKYSTRPLVVVYYDANFQHQYVKDTQFVRKKVLEVAKVYAQTNVKLAVCNEDEYAEELRELNLIDATEDIKIAAYGENNLKFRMKPTDDLEVEDLKEFIDVLASGKGVAYMKSQPVPSERQQKESAPVVNVVANTFVPLVLKSDKDVLIEFYAPWCGHCKALEPEYKKLAKRMKKENANLIVAKMDATANDVHPLFHPLIKGYPSIFFLAVGNKDEPILFNTTTSLNYKALKAFVDLHSSVFLSEEERQGITSERPVDEL